MDFAAFGEPIEPAFGGGRFRAIRMVLEEVAEIGGGLLVTADGGEGLRDKKLDLRSLATGSRER